MSMDKNKKERMQVFVDGGNFYHLALKKMGLRDLDFSLEELTNHLIGSREIVPLGKRYYMGTVREIIGNSESQRAMAKQTKFFTTLRSYGWEIKTSKLRNRKEKIVIDERVDSYQDILGKGITEIKVERSREKGIDVKLAVDLIVGAIDDRYDVATVISSDADLVPAIDWIKSKTDKKIEYIGFSILDETGKYEDTKPLQTMITYSSIQRILTKDDLKNFIKPFVMKS